MLRPFLVLTINILACTPSISKPVPGSCGPGEQWVQPHHQSAYVRANGVSVSAANVTGHCQKNPFGFDNWNTKKKAGLPAGWEHKEEKSRAWSEEEWERALEALGELPDSLLASTIKGLYRLQKSRFYPNPASGEPKSIAIYDSAFNSKDKLAQILAHEFAHELYRNLSDADRRSYQNSTHWFEQRIGNKTYTVRGRGESQFVEPDGMDSPAEDFSNNIETYLFDPKKLEKVTPQAFQWIQQHFGDNMKLRPQR